MSLIPIKQAVRRLSLGQLKKLAVWLQDLIRKVEDSARAEKPPLRKQVIEERVVENKTFRLERVRCGKDKCKCARGALHGPYWYSYSRAGDKTKSQYVGKKLPPEAVKSLRLRS